MISRLLPVPHSTVGEEEEGVGNVAIQKTCEVVRCIYTCMYMYTCTVHVHIHVYTCIHMYIHVYTCTCSYDSWLVNE